MSPKLNLKNIQGYIIYLKNALVVSNEEIPRIVIETLNCN